ncbi:MAG: hypothetical protein NZ455_08590 [Bacteroidia bacterium]|nr:hypothetical protein [Bacteroidia bacterium]MDW8348455.1 hypothetical protein [Bacteroidia bacterium]
MLFTLPPVLMAQIAAQKYPELDTKQYPDFWADYETLHSINELYYGGLNTQDPTVLRSQVENLPKSDSIVKLCERKYQKYMQRYHQVYHKPSAMEDVYTDAKNGVLLCYNQIQNSRLDMEAISRVAYHKMDSLLNQYLQQKTLIDETKNPLFSPKSELTRQLNLYVAYQGMLYLKQPTPERLAAIENAKNKVKNTYHTIRMHLLQNTELLPELYTASDKEKIREFIRKKWMEKYPKDEIIRIILPEKEWQKEDGKFFDNQKNETRYYDKSLLGLIVVKKEKNIADMWQVDLKRHESTKEEIILIQINKTPDTYMGEILIQKLQ